MVVEYVQHLKSQLHASPIGQLPWLEHFLGQVLDMLASPLTGIKTRYHWVQLIEGVLLTAFVFVTARGALGIGWAGFLRYCFPKALYNHPSSWVDYKLNVVNYFTGAWFNVTWRLNAPLMTAWVAGMMVSAFGPVAQPLEWNMWWLALFTLLLFLAEDLGYYLFHLASHKIPFLWALHKVHHSAEVLTPLTAGRVHPMEYAFVAPTRAVTTALVLGPAFYLFGSEPALVDLYGISLFVILSGALGEQLLHSHVWMSYGPVIERVILSPAQHQIHHSSAPQHWDRNFAGRFALWDWVFGTIYIPRGPEKIVYGIYGETRQPHPGLVSAYLRPYWDMLPFKPQIIALGTALFGTGAGRLAMRWRLTKLHDEIRPRAVGADVSHITVAAPTVSPTMLSLASLAGVLVVAAMGFSLHGFWMAANHDNDWYLIVTPRLMAGGRYIADFMEPNPPLILLLTIPSILIEHAAGLGRYVAFSLYISLLILLALGLARRYLRWLLADQPIGLAIATLGTAAILVFPPSYDFGQREHIFCILFLPGLLWFAAREAGRDAPIDWQDHLAILLAAVAALIKPFYLLVPAVLFLTHWARGRRLGNLLDPWVITHAFLTAAYLALIVFRFPDYLAAIPLYRDGYFGLERGWIDVVSDVRGLIAALILAFAMVEVLPLTRDQRLFLRPVVLTAVLGLVMGLIQKKGFGYQFMAALEFSLLALLLCAVLGGSMVRNGALSLNAATALAVGVLAQAGVLMVQPISELRTYSKAYHRASPVIQELRLHAEGRNLLVLDSGYRTGIPSLVGATLVGRAPSQVMLPGLVRLLAGSPAERQRGESLARLIVDQATEDLRRDRPDVVAVNAKGPRQALPDDFDILGFYLADPAFRAEWARYHKVGEARGWEFYRRSGG
jgi:sterol desaturase/sphingolipid hydroxylase (fatty acid hydroxylase superfamily)